MTILGIKPSINSIIGIKSNCNGISINIGNVIYIYISYNYIEVKIVKCNLLLHVASHHLDYY